MKDEGNFLNRITSTLNSLFNRDRPTSNIKPLKVKKPFNEESDAEKYQSFSEKANVVNAANEANGSNMPIPNPEDTQEVNNFMGVNPPAYEPGLLEQILSLLVQPQTLSPIAEDQGQDVLGASNVPTATPTVAPTVTPAPLRNDNNEVVDTLLGEYGFPPPVYYGMMQAEGGNIGANNPFNLGAFDSNPTNAMNYDTAMDGAIAFLDLITKNPRFAEAMKYVDNPKKMLEEIVKAGYAGDPNTWKQRSINQEGAGQNYDTYEDFVQNTAGWKNNYDE